MCVGFGIFKYHVQWLHRYIYYYKGVVRNYFPVFLLRQTLHKLNVQLGLKNS